MFGRLFGKKPQASESNSGARMLSMPLFAGTQAPNGDAIIKAAKAIAPHLDVSGEADAKDGSVSINVPSLGAMVMAVHTPQRIPTAEVDEAAQYTMWYQGNPVPVPYASHMLLIGIAPDPRSAAVAASIAAAACMKQPQAVAWYVGDAFSVYPPKLVVEMTTDFVEKDGFPTPLWVKPVVSQGASGFDASTTGLSCFGHNELEVIGSKQPMGELAMTLLDLASYIIESGAEFKHGQTCGGSAEEKWKIEVGPSKLGKDGKVARIRMP